MGTTQNANVTFTLLLEGHALLKHDDAYKPTSDTHATVHSLSENTSSNDAWYTSDDKPLEVGRNGHACLAGLDKSFSALRWR